MGIRLTDNEWDALLSAAALYEAEPANFEQDRSDARLEAIRSAIRKMQARNARRERRRQP